MCSDVRLKSTLLSMLQARDLDGSELEVPDKRPPQDTG